MKAIKVNKNNVINLSKKHTGIIEYSHGMKAWFLNGKLHRTDGPAIIWPDGRKAYYLNNEFLDSIKIDQFTKDFEYPIETAIKLDYFLQINKS